MKNGQCPKCNSTTIYTSEKGVRFGGAFVNVGGTDVKSWVSYICATCGYFENYVTDTKALNELSKRSFQKVEPTR